MSEALPYGTRGGTAIRHYFPLDGDYVVKVRLGKNFTNSKIRAIATPRGDSTCCSTAHPSRASASAAAASTRTAPECEQTDRYYRTSRYDPGGRRGAQRALPGDGRDAHARGRLRPQERAAGGAGADAAAAAAYELDLRGAAHGHRLRAARGPVRSHRPGRHAEPAPHLHLPSRRGGGRRAVRTGDSGGARAAGLPAPGERGGHRDAAALLPRRTRRGRLRARHPGGAHAAADLAGVPVPHRARSGAPGGGCRLFDQRRGAGLPPVVLPVEHHPRRRAARRRGARRVAGSGRAGNAGAAHAVRSPGRGADAELRRPVAARAEPEGGGSRRKHVSRVRRQPARVLPARDGAVSREPDCATTGRSRSC